MRSGLCRWCRWISNSAGQRGDRGGDRGIEAPHRREAVCLYREFPAVESPGSRCCSSRCFSSRWGRGARRWAGGTPHHPARGALSRTSLIWSGGLPRFVEFRPYRTSAALGCSHTAAVLEVLQRSNGAATVSLCCAARGAEAPRGPAIAEEVNRAEEAADARLFCVPCLLYQDRQRRI